jgi:hypothetical protein
MDSCTGDTSPVTSGAQRTTSYTGSIGPKGNYGFTSKGARTPEDTKRRRFLSSWRISAAFV